VPPPPPVPAGTSQLKFEVLQMSPMRPQSAQAEPLRPQKLTLELSGAVMHWPLAQQPVGQVLGLHEVLATQVSVLESQRWPFAPQSSHTAPLPPQKALVPLSGAEMHWPFLQQPVAQSPHEVVPPPPPVAFPPPVPVPPPVVPPPPPPPLPPPVAVPPPPPPAPPPVLVLVHWAAPPMLVQLEQVDACCHLPPEHDARAGGAI
jgi:hypothetical protein